jgi:hypothetical protein
MLISKQRVNPHRLHKLSEGEISSYEGARKILGRFERLSIARRLPNGSFEVSTHGVYVYLTTILSSPQELLAIAEQHGRLLPYSLGKTPHFEKEGVLDIALAAWKGINNPDEYQLPTIRAGDVIIRPDLDDLDARYEDVRFHIEARNLLQQEDIPRWSMMLERDPELKELTVEIEELKRQAYRSGGPELGLRAVSKEELAREGQAEFFKNAIVREI